MNSRSKKILKRILKIFGWVFLFLFLLVAGLVVALQFQATQNYLTQKVIHFVSDKTHTRVKLGEINVAFPKSIVLKDLFLEDQQHDTLLYSHRLAVDIDMMKLFSHRIELNLIDIQNLTSHISRSLPDSSFNFDFLINAFIPTTPVANTKSSWEFSLNNINLENIFFSFNDETAGSQMTFNIGNFKTHFKTFDLDAMKFDMGNIDLANTVASIIQTKVAPAATSADTASSKMNYDLNIHSINLSTVSFLFETPQQKLDMQVGKASVTSNNINLTQQKIDLEKFEMSDSKIDFVINKIITVDTVAQKVKDAVTTPSSETQQSLWKVTLQNLNLKNNQVAFNNLNYPVLKEGMDFNHLLISGIEADVKQLSYDEKNISANISEFKWKDQSGFELKHFQAKITYDSSHAELADLDLQTAHSNIRKYISIDYPSIETIVDSLANLKINADFDHAVIGLNDVLLLQPALAKQLQIKNPESQSFEITAKINGRVKDIHIPRLELTAAKNTTLMMSGNIKGLPDVQSAYFDITVQKFSTTNVDVQSLLNSSMLPSNISVPSSISISGFFKGYIKRFDGNANVKSSFGNATAKVNMEKNEVYHATLSSDHFDLAKLLRDTTLGPVTMNATVNGSGFSQETMKGNVDATISQVVLRAYNYHDIKVKGDFTGNEFNGIAAVNDSNVALTFNGLLNFDKQHPSYKATLNVEGMDLQALHFTPDDLRVKGILNVDLEGKDLNNLNGNITVSNAAITKNDTIYPVDSLLCIFISDSASKRIEIHSPFLTAAYKGKMGLADLPTALNQYFDRYFETSDSSFKEPITIQDFTFDAELRNTDLYLLFVPGLKKFSGGKISGDFKSASNQLTIQASIHQVEYNNILADSIQLHLNADESALHFNTSLEMISANGYHLLNPSFSGTAANNMVTADFKATDEKGETKYLFAGNFKKENANYHLSFIQDSMILNYLKWTVAPDNYLVFGNTTLYAHDVLLSNGNQSLKINSTGSKSENSPLEVALTDFDLGDLAHLIESNKILFGGVINGTVLLKNLQTTPGFTADLSIDDFNFMEDTLGNIKILSDNATADRYQVQVTVSGNGNDISVNGFYDAKQTDEALNFDAALASVNLSTLESFTFGQVTRMSGTMTGNLKIAGSTEQPNVNGKLKFSDAGFTPAYLNTHYKLKNEELTITDSKMAFNNFTLSDSLGATAVVNGFVAPDAKHLMNFDLLVETKNFLALNAPQNDTAQFYGKVILDSRIKISGNKDFPKVDANVKLNDGSALTVSKPKEEVKNVESKGVVIFLNRNDTLSSVMTRIKSDTSQNSNSAFTGMEVNATIQVNKNSTLTVVVDPAAGDSLQVKGDAALSFSLDPSGKTSLTGHYEISEGAYQLTFYNFVKRKFTLQPGGYLNWNGDPLSADINLTAVYEVRTSPIDLVADQISALSDQEKNAYQQQLPFRLYMNITGELLKPVITFSLDLPPADRGALGGSVYAKLNELNADEAELNKQVFGLLLLNRFVASDPLQSSQNNDVANVARNSVSTLLSQQLNRFASNYIKGVQINVNLNSYEDYTSGTPQGRTQLELGVSKQFLNNRLNVSVGGNLDLEGEKAKQNSVSNIAGDVSAEYKLSPDGTYRLRFYHRSEYDILQGEIIEDGLGLVFTKDYNRTRDLFKHPKPKPVPEIIIDH
ncbi:MAG: translocation/assembly module TamB domain-containing protein [Chitinophagales bacterium]|nr:translocation/assembly module TamB domain-containing protein [Chitinophagales bacterium]